MTQVRALAVLIGVLLVTGMTIGQPAMAKESEADAGDPNGILRKPIPEKLVVLTFDDGPASGYTVVAPILKSLEYNGSFYICDFDSFSTRKDWYMTWRQMRALAADGFEIGNHTKGHAGGAAIGPFLSMEDDLLANHVPKPTTIAWPVFQVNTKTYPDLAANGYIFGRGGHNRAYRPTVDNPFDVPSMWFADINSFVNCVRHATGGKIVVLTFHGVPDMEHPSVGLDPAVFKVMMQYLKDNNYKAIALRDLAEYIDPAKAAKLPPTANEVKEPGPVRMIVGDKPPVGMNISKPRIETAAGNRTAVSTAKEMLAFALPGPASATISGTNVGVYVPTTTDVTALAPTFTLSPLAKAVPASGTVRDFSKPQTYTITAQDGASQVVTVTVVKSSQPNAFTWNTAAAGNWSDGSKWSNNLNDGAGLATAGRLDYMLNFNKPGNYAVNCDLNEGFLLNQLNFNGASVRVEGKLLAFVTNDATATQPAINQFSRGGVAIILPVKLAANVTVDATGGGEVTLGGLVSGTGGLTKNGDGQLRITNVKNTYSGGTTINRGSLFLLVANEGLGSGPVTLNGDAALDLEHVDGTNPLILNGGIINAGNGFGDSWNGNITLNGNTKITSYADFVLNSKSGGMSGPGGFTQIGSHGGFGLVNAGQVTLCGINTYTGPTTVRLGTLRILKAVSLYNADTASWTPERISVANTARLRLSVGGAGEFTGEQIGALLKNLTASVNNNGLMAGAVLCLDTSNATGAVMISADIADSKGPGGGAFVLRKCGTGTMQLCGNNTYTGQTVLEGGTLSVASLNSVVGGKPSSSMGTPATPDIGEIVFGHDGGDGDCTLIYTGTGETTDRELNMAGNTLTATFDQSGTGLLKFTSTLTISGHGHNKMIVLKGSAAGRGEMAGSIADPYDRAGKAMTAVTKSGAGTWTLSGTNSYAGPTRVTQGKLSLANARSLGEKTDVYVSDGATLELSFSGEMRIGKLYLDGKLQPAGVYSATNTPKYIKGNGVLKNQGN